jgi:hypothetical protein
LVISKVNVRIHCLALSSTSIMGMRLFNFTLALGSDLSWLYRRLFTSKFCSATLQGRAIRHEAKASHYASRYIFEQPRGYILMMLKVKIFTQNRSY